MKAIHGAAGRVYDTTNVAILSATQKGLGHEAQGALDEKLLEKAAALVGAHWDEGSETVRRGWFVPDDTVFERADGYWLGKHDGKSVAFGPVSIEDAHALAREFGQDAFIHQDSLYDVRDDGEITRVRHPEATVFGLKATRLDGYTLFEDGTAMGHVYPAVQEFGEAIEMHDDDRRSLGELPDHEANSHVEP